MLQKYTQHTTVTGGHSIWNINTCTYYFQWVLMWNATYTLRWKSNQTRSPSSVMWKECTNSNISYVCLNLECSRVLRVEQKAEKTWYLKRQPRGDISVQIGSGVSQVLNLKITVCVGSDKLMLMHFSEFTSVTSCFPVLYCMDAWAKFLHRQKQTTCKLSQI